jgi:hypothetical protein
VALKSVASAALKATGEENNQQWRRKQRNGSESNRWRTCKMKMIVKKSKINEIGRTKNAAASRDIAHPRAAHRAGVASAAYGENNRNGNHGVAMNNRGEGEISSKAKMKINIWRNRKQRKQRKLAAWRKQTKYQHQRRRKINGVAAKAKNLAEKLKYHRVWHRQRNIRLVLSYHESVGGEIMAAASAKIMA